MTKTQKIEASREIRQWIKLGLSALGIAAVVNPEGTKKTIGKCVDKVKNFNT